MELRPVKRFCQGKGSGSACPAVYETDEPGVVAIQGYDVAFCDRPADLPEGESVIAVPSELIRWIKENFE